MKKLVLVFAVALLAGCSGMVTAWDFQLRSVYQTPVDRAADKAPAKKEPL